VLQPLLQLRQKQAGDRLIAGGPADIPYTFQSQLDVQATTAEV
jgi:hypothetical protein